MTKVNVCAGANVAKWSGFHPEAAYSAGGSEGTPERNHPPRVACESNIEGEFDAPFIDARNKVIHVQEATLRDLQYVSCGMSVGQGPNT